MPESVGHFCGKIFMVFDCCSGIYPDLSGNILGCPAGYTNPYCCR